jgi:hypothetical protein
MPLPPFPKASDSKFSLKGTESPAYLYEGELLAVPSHDVEVALCQVEEHLEKREHEQRNAFVNKSARNCLQCRGYRY